MMQTATQTPKADKNPNGALLERPKVGILADLRFVNRLKKGTVLELNIHSVGENDDSDSEDRAQSAKRVKGITVYLGKEIVAWLMFVDDFKVHMHVRQKYRRLGIGTYLFKYAERLKGLKLQGDNWDYKSTKFYDAVTKEN